MKSESKLAHYIYKRFLRDEREYSACENYWTGKFNDLFSGVLHDNDWTVWLSNKFGNGRPIRDGNPIISFISRRRHKGVRVVQTAPRRSKRPKILAYLDSCSATDESDHLEEFVLIVALQDDTWSRVEPLMKAWVVDDIEVQEMSLRIHKWKELDDQQKTQRYKEHIQYSDTELKPAARPAASWKPEHPKKGSQEDFEQAMVELCSAMRREGHKPILLEQKIKNIGGLQTARRMLRKPKVSGRFEVLHEQGQLALSIEALVVEPRWKDLFSPDEIMVAVHRLRQHGYKFP